MVCNTNVYVIQLSLTVIVKENLIQTFACHFSFHFFLQQLGPLFDVLGLQYNVQDYPELYITRNHSSVFIAARAFCDPNKYLFNDNPSQLTVDIHKLINDLDNSTECTESGTLLPGSVR